MLCLVLRYGVGMGWLLVRFCNGWLVKCCCLVVVVILILLLCSSCVFIVGKVLVGWLV